MNTEETRLNYGAVVVTFNRQRLLEEAVDSLLAQTIKPQSIIVIDNASTDGTNALFTTGRFSNEAVIDYHRMTENSGGAGGFAEGVRVAAQHRFDWLSLSDDDAIFNADYFEKLSDEIEASQNVSAFAGKVVLPDTRIQVDQRQIIRNWDRLKTYALTETDYDDARDIDVFTFCGAFIKMNLVRKIGVPNKDFFIWGDDIEYSLRVRQTSAIRLVPQAVLVHKTKVPSIDFAAQYQPDWREYYGLRNHVVTVLDHESSPIRGHALLYGWMLAKFLLTCTGRFKGYRRHIRRVYRDAFGDGLKRRLGKNERYLPGIK